MRDKESHANEQKNPSRKYNGCEYTFIECKHTQFHKSNTLEHKGKAFHKGSDFNILP